MAALSHGDPDGVQATGLPEVDHLMVWLTGRSRGGDPPVVLDDEIQPGLSLEAWVSGVQEGYPDAVVSIVYDRPQPGAERAWADRLDLVVAALDGSGGRFTGDTTPTSVPRTRDWVRSVVGDVRQRGGQDWADEGVSDVVLVTDELVNNVEEHAAGWLTVDLTWDGEGVSVGVTDPRPTALPLPRRPAPSDRSGRGLMVVSALCPTWGVLVGPHTKTVWAWVPLTSSGRHPDRAV